MERRAFRLEVFRSSASGILEAAWQTFALVVVTRYFDGTPFEKGLTVTAFMIGLLLNPLSTFYFGKFRFKAATACSWMYYVIGVLMVALGFCRDNLTLFLAVGVIAAAVMAQQIPMLLHIYTTAFSSARRGQYVAMGMSLGLITSLPYGYFGGAILDRDISFFPYLFWISAATSLIAGYVTKRIPSNEIEPSKKANPFSHLSLAWNDKVFGALLIMWMILGFGNLATFHLRVEYMGAEAHGINATNTQIALCVLIIPSLIRLVTTPIWGFAFDRFDFFPVRAVVNMALIFATLTFFFSSSMNGFYLGSVLYGFAMAGARVNWSLWVTKFAPEGQSAAYMSVHGFLTGVRGVIAPFVGFYLLEMLTVQQTASFTSSLIFIATLTIWPISRLHRRTNRSASETASSI